ncbi:hypothetical protein [Chitinophaga sp.]|uniref:hypothetical protein n=1 Tax=Chitinophaga sp. TaxID=1869181 RepID=UPI002F9208F9
MKKHFTIFLLLIIAISCNESKLSHEKIGELSLIRAEVSIYQRLYNKEENQIVVNLYDEEGKTIKNDSVKIYVNGAALKYTVRQELYYTTQTYYFKENALPQDNKFRFEIALTDGKKFFLAEANALALASARNIITPKAGDLNKDIDVRWKDLGAVNYLVISRSLKIKKQEDPHVTTYEEQASDTVNIQPTGQQVFPKSTFDNAETQLSVLSLKFVAFTHGSVNPQLIKGSEISIQGDIEERIFFGN